MAVRAWLPCVHTYSTFSIPRKTVTRKVSYWYGGRSAKELFYTEEFRQIEAEFPNFTYNIALSEPLPEDNWTGLKGFIHMVLFNEYLSKHPEPEEVEYYLRPTRHVSSFFKIAGRMEILGREHCF